MQNANTSYTVHNSCQGALSLHDAIHNTHTRYAIRVSPHSPNTQYAYAIRDTHSGPRLASMQNANTSYTVHNSYQGALSLHDTIHNTQCSIHNLYHSLCSRVATYAIHRTSYTTHPKQRCAIHIKQYTYIVT